MLLVLPQLAHQPSTDSLTKSCETGTLGEDYELAGHHFVDSLAEEMTHRLLHSETGRDLQPADLADTAWALLASGHK